MADPTYAQPDFTGQPCIHELHRLADNRWLCGLCGRTGKRIQGMIVWDDERTDPRTFQPLRGELMEGPGGDPELKE